MQAPARLYRRIWSRLRNASARSIASRLLRALGLRRVDARAAQASALFSSASRLAAEHRHDEALRDLYACVALVPGDLQALLTRLQIQAHLQRHDDALDTGLLVLELDPSCSQVRPSLNELLLNPALAHRHDEALRRLEPRFSDATRAAAKRAAAVELMPAFVQRVDDMIAAGSLAAAAERLRCCEALVPESTAVRIGLIRLRIAERLHADALDICLGALDDDPASDALVASMGVILQGLRSAHRLSDVGNALSRYLAARGENVAGIACLAHWVDALVRTCGARAAAAAVESALGDHPDFHRLRDHFRRLLADGERSADIASGQSLLVAPSDAERDAYDRLVAMNVVATIEGIARRFYREIGCDAASAPLVAFMEGARESLGTPSLDEAAGSAWPLLRFEAGWYLYLAGERDRSIALLRTVAEDPVLPAVAGADRFAKEALVRSGEIVGRRDERAGNLDQAMSIYGRTMQLDENAVVARRMALLRWRKGDIRGAMEAADAAVMSKANLFPRLPEGPYVSQLRRSLAEGGGRMSGLAEPERSTR